MKLTIVEKNLLSWTAMHIDFVMCNSYGQAIFYYFQATLHLKLQISATHVNHQQRFDANR